MQKAILSSGPTTRAFTPTSGEMRQPSAYSSRDHAQYRSSRAARNHSQCQDRAGLRGLTGYAQARTTGMTSLA